MRIAVVLLAPLLASAQGPCDIFGAAGTPCVAAHSMARALYQTYEGPLYQVTRRSDNATTDVSPLYPGGSANATAQDAFCATSAVPPLGTVVNIVPAGSADSQLLSFRHCDAQGFVTPTDGNPDHAFTLVAPLNGAANAVSFQSVNYPTWYVAPITGAEPGRVGIVEAPAADDASWLVSPDPTGVHVTLAVLAPSRAGTALLAPGSNLTGSCAGSYAPPSASVYLGGAAYWWRLEPLAPPPLCFVSVLYDQSGRGNHLTPGPPGGAAPHRDQPVNAAALPVTVGGSPVYGALFEAGMGYRADNTSGVATGNDPETIYMVTSGARYNSGCCFDYGNAETNDHDDGAGTMEAVYFGTWNATQSGWCGGAGGGPWVMADLENGLWACNATGTINADNTPQTAPFVMAMVKGGTDGFALKGGSTYSSGLPTLWDGPRPSGYQPMKKQGALILGIGGDNSDSAIGAFFEGAVLAGYSTDAADAAVKDNIGQAEYTMVRY